MFALGALSCLVVVAITFAFNVALDHQPRHRRRSEHPEASMARAEFETLWNR